MTFTLVAIFALLVVAFFVIPFLLRRGPGEKFPYRPVPLFSAAEIRFLSALDSFVAGRARVLSKVRLADLVNPDLPYRSPRWYRAFNRVSAKHLDFVLVSVAGKVLAAIELDDSSHSQPDRAARDRFVQDVLDQAKIPLHRFPVRSSYSGLDLKALDNILSVR